MGFATDRGMILMILVNAGATLSRGEVVKDVAGDARDI